MKKFLLFVLAIIYAVPSFATCPGTCSSGTASTTQLNYLSAATGTTGTGNLCFGTSPILVTPLLGTPTSGNLANCTFPTLNQDTTGSAVYWKTSGTGKAALTGPAIGTTRTYTFPDADATMLTTTGSPAAMVIASQATGDLLYASSASAWSRLGKGGAFSLLRTNTGATLPEWSTATIDDSTANVTKLANGTSSLQIKAGQAINFTGTFTDGRSCTYTASGNVINCDTTVGGGGNVSNSGSPTQYQWPQWASATTLTGNTVTANKVVCSGTNSVPVACTNLTDVAVPTGTFASQSYGSTAVGDILIGGTSGVPTGKVADVGSGSPLISGGTGTAPAYATYLFSGTGAATYTFPGTTSTLLATNGSAASLTNFPTLNQDTGGSAVYWKTSGTGKAALTGPATGTIRTYTGPDADATLCTTNSVCSGYQASGTYPTQAGIQAESYTAADDTGSANAYAITISPTPTLAAYSWFSFKAAHTNTTTSTLAVNGGAAKTIYKWGGATTLVGGEITVGQIVRVIYDGTNFQMQSQAANTNTMSIQAANNVAITGGTISGVVTTPVWTTIATTANATSGEKIMADTSGGAFAITLPTSPAAGAQVTIIDAAGTFGTYNLTIGRNSQPIMGTAADYVLNVNNANVELVYYSVTYGWRILGMQPATVGLMYSYGEVR